MGSVTTSRIDVGDLLLLQECPAYSTKFTGSVAKVLHFVDNNEPFIRIMEGHMVGTEGTIVGFKYSVLNRDWDE